MGHVYAENIGLELVGDAAMGMPFYRAVNSGLLLGSQLAMLLASPMRPTVKTAAYDLMARPVRVIREGARILFREMTIKTVKDVARPMLRRAMLSRMGPMLADPVERVVTRMKYGKRYALARAAR